jgi:CubicO group peptidase (beta-lactamase class C family)
MVTRRGSIVVDLAGGLAVVETGVACTAGTRFQICSVSKQFTAAAVMLLVESGRVDLNEPVDRWMPEAPAQWREVTLHQLLSHTAGVPHWLESPDLNPADPMSLSQRVEIIQTTPLRTEPGAEWHYSSPGFVLAGCIVERASGEPYQDFLAERILSPLQLSHTSLGATPDGAARGYRNARPVTPFDLSAMCGSGDLWSTTGDLTRFTAALHGGELISSNSLRAMCTAHAPIDDDDDEELRLTTTGYGYGMFTGIFAGHVVFFHPGDNPGYQSLACWIPDESASIVILANDEDVSITSLLRQLLPPALEI